MTVVTPPRPLAGTDDCSKFDCGQERLNSWLARHAWSNHRSGASRISIVTDTGSGRIVGYVTLNSAQIDRAFLPKSQQRNRPDPVPVTLLGQLAVDRAYQGQGHSKSLLVFALKTAMIASRSVGSIGVITHPIDYALRSFYARWGFVELPSDPRGAMLARMEDLISDFGFEGWQVN